MPEKTAKRLTITIPGRILSSQQVGTDKENFPIIETLIVTPAPDAYSHPDRYCVNSRSKLGNKDQDVSVEVYIYCRQFKDSKGRWHYPHSLWAI